MRILIFCIKPEIERVLIYRKAVLKSPAPRAGKYLFIFLHCFFKKCFFDTVHGLSLYVCFDYGNIIITLWYHVFKRKLTCTQTGCQWTGTWRRKGGVRRTLAMHLRMNTENRKASSLRLTENCIGEATAHSPLCLCPLEKSRGSGKTGSGTGNPPFEAQGF